MVDRRFYRSRYDAQQTLEQFAGQLRDQVELDAVGEVLVDVGRHEPSGPRLPASGSASGPVDEPDALARQASSSSGCRRRWSRHSSSGQSRVEEPLTPDIVLFPAAYLAFGAVRCADRRPPARQPDRPPVPWSRASSGVRPSRLFDIDRPPSRGRSRVKTWPDGSRPGASRFTLAPPLLLILLFPTGRLASTPVATRRPFW